MPMSSGGHVASASGCATRPKAREIGSSGYAGPTQHSSPIGRYVMATAEHREPCDSRGSCTVLGAPGGENSSGRLVIHVARMVHRASRLVRCSSDCARLMCRGEATCPIADSCTAASLCRQARQLAGCAHDIELERLADEGVGRRRYPKLGALSHYGARKPR